MLFFVRPGTFCGTQKLILVTSDHLNQDLVIWDFFLEQNTVEWKILQEQINCLLVINALSHLLCNKYCIDFMLFKGQYLQYELRIIFCVSIETDNVICCMSINVFTGCLETLIWETPDNSDHDLCEGR